RTPWRTCCRSRTRSIVGRPWLAGPHLQTAVSHGDEKLAHVRYWILVRSRFRHRNRDLVIHGGGKPSLRRTELRDRDDLPSLVRRGNDIGRYQRQRAHGRRLWLGFPQSDPQDLV